MQLKSAEQRLKIKQMEENKFKSIFNVCYNAKKQKV